MRASWFPIEVEQMENEVFRKLTPVEKLFYWTLASEFNLNGQFYKADAWFAAALKVSEDKIRKARRKFQSLGWIQTKPGFKSAGKNVATSYQNIKWSVVPEEGSGKQFVQFQRYILDMLFAQIRRDTFDHKDVVVYVYAYCWKQLRYRFTAENTFVSFVTKRQLKEMTNIPNANECLKRLYEGFEYTGGSHLFAYKDEYHKYTFDAWNTPIDPSASGGEQNAQNAERYRKEIDEAAKLIRNKKAAKEKEKARLAGQTVDEDIRPKFLGLYKDRFGRYPSISVLDEMMLFEVLSISEPEAVESAIKLYMDTDIIPYTSAKNTRTLTTFLLRVEDFLELSKHVYTTPLPVKDLSDAFECVYQNRYLERPKMLRTHIEDLEILGREHGTFTVLNAIDEFINDIDLPDGISKHRTLKDFVWNAKQIMPPLVKWDGLSGIS